MLCLEYLNSNGTSYPPPPPRQFRFYNDDIPVAELAAKPNFLPSELGAEGGLGFYTKSTTRAKPPEYYSRDAVTMETQRI